METSSWSSMVESLATAYAAIVATAAFALEFRRWFKEGPKLVISLVPDGVLVGGGPERDEQDLLIVHVVNRGSEPTTIENLCLFEYPSPWRLWRRRPAKSFVVPRPEVYPNRPAIPYLLEPNTRWTGVVRKRIVKMDLQTGDYYVGVAASHTSRMQTRQIPKRKPPLPPIGDPLPL